MQRGEASGAARRSFRDLDASERPRERLERLGPGALSDAELLALLLRTGTATASVLRVAQDLHERLGGLSGLQRATLHELQAIDGLGPAKAVELQACFELGRRLAALPAQQRRVVTDAGDVAAMLRPAMAILDQEELRLVLVGPRQRLIGLPVIYRGSTGHVPLNTGEIFRAVLRAGAIGFYVVHNHPSGDPMPSLADIDTTRDLEAGASLLDLTLHDHIIIGADGWLSLRHRGLGFTPAR